MALITAGGAGSVSSDAMINKAPQVHAALGEEPLTVMNPKYNFLNKDTMWEAFPSLEAWSER